MPSINLKPLYHRQQECIGLFYANNSSLNNIVKKLPAIKSSQTYKCWYLPLSKDNYNKLHFALQGKAEIMNDDLKEYLEKRKKINSIVVPVQSASNSQPGGKHSSPIWKLSKENLEALENFVQQLKLKAYSDSTIRTYRNEFSQLLQLLASKPVNDVTPEMLKRYLVYCYEKLRLTENTLHSRINAIKFYFEQVLGKEKFFWEIPRPKKALQLPRLLNEKELANLFNALANKKHKTMLFTAYSAGLRVSEIVNLKLKDIDSSRMQIFIEKAKGKKDRYVNLSPVLLDILRSYLKTADPRPTKFLFESGYTTDAYPIRTVQQIFSNAKTRAGIQKEVGIHSLRHSFATHLLEKGTDIRYIKDLLGHFDIKTTERYLHVAKQKLVNIISPLDDLVEKGGITW